MRVTDLDKFSLEEIWRPYQSYAGYGERLTSAPMSLEETADQLRQNTIWSQHVLRRISDMRVTFPEYVVHPLVTVIRAAVSTTPS